MATVLIGGPGQGLSLNGQKTNAVTLQASQTMLLPAGQSWVKTGIYTQLQCKDPTSGQWLTITGTTGAPMYVSSDGTNWRLANLTGTVVGASVTQGGSGYTSAPTVTASAGGAAFTAIVGGVLDTAVTVSAGGSGYTYPPIVLIGAAPNGAGYNATGYATLTNGVVTSITLVNRGAGYLTAPTITLVNDPRDTTGSGATATCILDASEQTAVTGVLVTNNGTAVTAVPTLTFTGGGGSSAAATAIMCFTTTGLTVDSGGSGYTAPVEVFTSGGLVSAVDEYVNPLYTNGLFTPRMGRYTATVAAGAITDVTVEDGGLFSAVPGVVAASLDMANTAAAFTVAVGGRVDTSYLQQVA